MEQATRRSPAWKVGYLAFMAVLVLLVVLAMVWASVYVLWRP